jgi:hypothetical protein
MPLMWWMNTYMPAWKKRYMKYALSTQGKGELRRIVHSLLEKHPLVARFTLDLLLRLGRNNSYLKKNQ